MKSVFLCVLISISFVSMVFSDSLFENAQTPFYGVSRRQIQIGDIITINKQKLADINRQLESYVKGGRKLSRK
mgnify:CR=1 FL=1